DAMARSRAARAISIRRKGEDGAGSPSGKVEVNLWQLKSDVLLCTRGCSHGPWPGVRVARRTGEGSQWLSSADGQEGRRTRPGMPDAVGGLWPSHSDTSTP